MYHYTPKKVCTRDIAVELKGDIIEQVVFTGGCNGNLKAISKLIQGKSIFEIAPILEGNTCGGRSTSCADQLVHALRAAYSENNSQ